MCLKAHNVSFLFGMLKTIRGDILATYSLKFFLPYWTLLCYSISGPMTISPLVMIFSFSHPACQHASWPPSITLAPLSLP